MRTIIIDALIDAPAAPVFPSIRYVIIVSELAAKSLYRVWL
jgi:hypothetical protein